MPLREDLLAPIPGDNPSGKSLRYDRVYDQIKDARTEEDDTLPAGAWERSAKRADYRLASKLATDALATKSKDLQIAAWLGESHLNLEGASQLAPVLELFLKLQQTFWDTIYPEIDEGDAGLRAVPLQWAANRYAQLVYELPLTRSKINFLTYKAARALGSEAEVAGNEARRKARADAIGRGQLTTEEVDQAIAESPKSLYATLEEELRESQDQLEALTLFCEERYGDDGPSFRKLRDGLEEVHNLVQAQLNLKRRAEPDPLPAEEALVAPPEPPAPVMAAPAPVPAAPVQAAPPAPVAAAPPPVAAAPVAPRPMGATPQSWEDAEAVICGLTRYMAQQRRGSAVPFQVATSIRWGELRRELPRPPATLMEAPSPADREFLQAAAGAGRWSDVQDRAFSLIGEAAGRACLDLPRFLWQAVSKAGFGYYAGVIVRSVRELLTEYPELLKRTLVDGTPTADAETQQWISAEVLPVAAAEEEPIEEEPLPEVEEEAPPPPAAPEPVVPAPPLQAAAQPVAPAPVAAVATVAAPAPVGGGRGAFASEGAGGEDAVLLQATAMARAGQLREATRMLARDATMQPTGRLRYRRRLELAQLCVEGKSSGVATPVLRELIAEIDERRLESWEEFDMVTRPMVLMLQCMTKPEEAEERDRLLDRLSLLDPTAALEVLL